MLRTGSEAQEVASASKTSALQVSQGICIHRPTGSLIHSLLHSPTPSFSPIPVPPGPSLQELRHQGAAQYTEWETWGVLVLDSSGTLAPSVTQLLTQENGQAHANCLSRDGPSARWWWWSPHKLQKGRDFPERNARKEVAMQRKDDWKPF